MNFLPEFPQEIVERVRSHVDIVQVIGEHVRLERKGRAFWGLCPFHSEKSPSFHVDPEKQLYYCFGCQAGGNAYSFLMEYSKMPFFEALENLAERAGIELPQQVDDQEAMLRKQQRERDLKIMSWAAEVFVKQLINEQLGKVARDYLAKRGLSADLMNSLKIGYSLPAWGTLIERGQKAGISTDELIRVGLAVQGDSTAYDRFRHRVMFPICDRRGQIIAFGGRVLDDSQPKYLNSPETPIFHKGRELFGLDRAARAIGTAGFAIVVEGYMDAITPWQYGVDNVVASLGTALSQDHAHILKRYTNEVNLCFDADIAGQNAALRGMDILRKAGISVKVTQLEQGKDPDDYLRKFGKERFLSLVTESALPLVEYRILQLSKEHDLSIPNGLGAFAAQVAKTVAEVENAVERDGYIKKALQSYRLPEGAFMQELAKVLGKLAYTDKLTIRRHNTSDRGLIATQSGWVKASRLLIHLMVRFPRHREKLFQFWSEIGFPEGKYQQLATWLLHDVAETDDPISLAHELPSDLKSELVGAYNEQIIEENAIEMANECFVKIEEHHIDQEVEGVMKDVESANSSEERNQLLLKRRDLGIRKKRLRERKVPSRGGISLE
ncbi:MAG: DNA primase [Bacillota bacterium]|nr:MAG: DNA primase [Bacillota bacterium]